MSDNLDTAGAVSAYLGGQGFDPAVPLRQSVAGAMSANPQFEAELQKAARRTGVSALAAREAPDDVMRAARVQALDFGQMVQQFPQTSAWMLNQDNARVAHDDVDTLTAIERAVGRATRYVLGAEPGGGMLGDTFRGAVYGGNASAAGAFRAVTETAALPLDALEQFPAIGGNPLRRLSEGFGRIAQDSLAKMRDGVPQGEGLVMSGVRSGFQSLGQNLLTLPLALLPGGQAAALTGMSAQAGGQSYQKAREAGVGQGAALGYGLSDAAVEFATERLPLSKLLGDVKAGAPLVTALLKNAALEIPGEQVATVLQDLNEWAVLNPDKPFSSYLAERPSAAAQTLIATLIGTGGQVTLMQGVQRAVDGMTGRDRRAEFAQRQAEAMAELTTLAEASKLRERDPENFGAFAQSLTEQGVPLVYVDAQALMQSGVDMQAVAQALPSVAAQVQAAAAGGGDLAIPTAEFLTLVAGQPFAAPMIEHARTAPDAMSKAEADQYMTERGDQLQAEVARVLAERQQDDAFTASRDEVAAEFKRQLDETKRFTSDVTQAYASLLGNFYAVTAARLGVTPGDLVQRYPLQVRADGVAGAGFEQAAPDTEAFRAWFGDSKVVDAEGKPLVVYHGTNSTFATFDANKTMDGAFWFSSSKEKIQRGEAGAAGAAKLMPVYLSVKKMAGWDQYESMTTDQILAAGYDGIQLDDDYIVFSPTQIKSATSNRGTFDPNDPSILNKDDGTRGQIALTSEGAVISLFKGADLSTFIHESGHFFLEVQADMAARIQAQIDNGASVSDGEREVVDDMNRLLAWFGVTGSPERTPLQAWHDMTLDEKRPHHEQFARGFEAYAFEGRAPSLELQPLFQRFRAWLVNIYRELKALNVTLTDEVRGVMDRMIASTEAIKEAEAARQMGALFATPEQAGMTLEEFQAYHALHVDATQEAIQALQARGLRDMKWLGNARARVLKRLQKEHQELRRDTEREVRAELMAQPVYQAWQFLTAKAPADQTATGEKPKASRALDRTRDSLLVAIAKLGGIDRASAARDLSMSADYFSHPSGVFGKPIFRKEGGMSADYMAEALAEDGYLPLDENGKHSLRDLEERMQAELHGDPQFSLWKEYGEQREGAPIGDVVAGKLRTSDVKLSNPEQLALLTERRMLREEGGLHPDVVAEMFGFTSGDELIQALAAADAPRVAVAALADQRMLERHGDLGTPEGLQRAADAAIHTEARARMVATELAALRRATSVREGVPGQRNTVDVMARAARDYAAAILGRLKVRDIRPGQYAAAEARAAAAAQKAMAKGDTAEAASQKQNQLIQHQAARQAYDAQDEVRGILQYLRKFEKRPKSVAADYLDQIEALLERTDLRPASLKAIDKRKTLAAWVEAQREQNLEPDIPEDLLNEAFRQSWRDMTLDELRGLRDTVKQIEHLGRLKNKLLTAKEQREWEAIRDEIAESIEANAGDRQADTRTPATTLGRAWKAVRDFGAAHIKVATLARIFDGGQDGGPVWEHLIRGANEAGDMETTMRAQATAALHEILAPLLARGKMGGKGKFFATIGQSLNREQILAIALNTGNDGNLQRLLGGEGWTMSQLQPVLDTLTVQDWQAVQAIWDHFESYRPLIGAKERRIYGKEPNWVEPAPRTVTVGGQTVNLRGGYFPIKYDPLATSRAEQHNDAEAAKRQLQGAYTSATTRRGFTKSRAEEVSGRPLLYSLGAIYGGVNDVIHDLAWHEWLIDANKIMRSDTIDAAIRQHYGPAAVRQIKTWINDVATGDSGLQAELDGVLGRLRHGVSIAGLGFNVMSAFLQPLGLTQSAVRVGPKWIGKGVAQYVAAPLSKAREVNELSDFMANRARTRFRELNELRNQVEGQNRLQEFTGRYAYLLMMRFQQMVDVPTWLGAYEKAMADGNDEVRAVALADQAVIDAQGGGMTKDLSAIERGGPAQKLFTVFYSFMNTALNVGVAQGMTEKRAAKLAADMVLLYVVPALLATAIKDALTPGDSGDWEEWDKIVRKLLAEQLGYLMGLFVVGREFGEAAKTAAGLSDHPRDYSGPAGVRLISDSYALGKQVNQGEFDDSFRKAAVNVLGDLFALPAAQINRSVTGAKALAEGETQNPAALVFGFQKER